MNYRHNQEFITAFGNHVRKLRKEHGLSMRALAKEAEIEYKQLALIEYGQINTSISMAYAIAEALCITHQELFDFKFPLKAKKTK